VNEEERRIQSLIYGVAINNSTSPLSAFHRVNNFRAETRKPACQRSELEVSRAITMRYEIPKETPRINATRQIQHICKKPLDDAEEKVNRML